MNFKIKFYKVNLVGRVSSSNKNSILLSARLPGELPPMYIKIQIKI